MFNGGRPDSVGCCFGQFFVRWVAVRVRLKAGEVMAADKHIAGRLHGTHVQSARHLMGSVAQQWAAGAIAQNGVTIELADSVKARMKARIHTAHAPHCNIARQPVVQRRHELTWRQARFYIDMRRHRQRVNATVSPPRRLYADQLSRQVSHGRLNRCLHTPVRPLALPAVEALPVEFNIKDNPAHGTEIRHP